MRARGGVRRRLSGECRESTRGRRKSGGIRHPWGVPRQNPSPSAASAAAVRTACHGSVRRRRKQAGPVALEQSRGKKRPPRAAARQLPHRGVVRAREGDGNQPESVALGTPHGRIRPPRQLSRHLPCGMSRNRAKATGIGRNPSPLGHLAAESVPPRRLLRHLPCRLLKTPATPARPHSAFRYHVAHED